MAIDSSIEWTEATWNPVTGCTKVSPGCKHCYAETMAKRLERMGQANYANGFKLTLQPHMLDRPLGWRKPRRVFVNSMSDLFHMDVPDDYVQRVFETMRKANWHNFQVLTKRADRLAEMDRHGQLHWAPNIWMGVSVETQAYLDRIDLLRGTRAAVKFLSIEPLLEHLGEIGLSGIDWVIVGGESGHNARPMQADWVRSVRDQCHGQNVPFFFKQWGGIQKHTTGRELDGSVYDEFPTVSLPVLKSA